MDRLPQIYKKNTKNVSSTRYKKQKKKTEEIEIKPSDLVWNSPLYHTCFANGVIKNNSSYYSRIIKKFAYTSQK